MQEQKCNQKVTYVVKS